MAGVSLKAIMKRYARSGVVVDNIYLEIADGEFFTILGPSGCGKTTTLRMIAGFEEPTAGQICFGDRDITNLAVNKRDVGIVFQNYALFPHLSVGKNVAFGLRARNVKSVDVTRRVSEALQQVHMGGYEAARVDELSGGQQQRVALARAVVIRPEILLLDEPLSNLDAKLREETRSTLRRLHAETGKTSVYVTHDQAEALAMSTKIAVMNAGTIHQVGTPDEIYTEPATRFVASFIGNTNIIDGFIEDVTANQVDVRMDNQRMLSVPVEQRTQGVRLERGSQVGVMIRAEEVRTVTSDTGENTVTGVVEDVEFVGARLEVAVNTPVGRLDVEMPRGQASVGANMRLQLPSQALRLVEPADDTAN